MIAHSTGFVGRSRKPFQVVSEATFAFLPQSIAVMVNFRGCATRLLHVGVDAHLLARAQDGMQRPVPCISQFSNDLRQLRVRSTGVNDRRDARSGDWATRRRLQVFARLFKFNFRCLLEEACLLPLPCEGGA